MPKRNKPPAIVADNEAIRVNVSSWLSELRQLTKLPLCIDIIDKQIDHVVAIELQQITSLEDICYTNRSTNKKVLQIPHFEDRCEFLLYFVVATKFIDYQHDKCMFFFTAQLYVNNELNNYANLVLAGWQEFLGLIRDNQEVLGINGEDIKKFEERVPSVEVMVQKGEEKAGYLQKHWQDWFDKNALADDFSPPSSTEGSPTDPEASPLVPLGSGIIYNPDE